MTLICFASQKGSPGATATALAVAASLQVAPGRRKLLLEADATGGTLAIRYRLPVEPGLLTLAAAVRGGLDGSDGLWRHAQELPGGLPVVVCPDGPEQVNAALAAGGAQLGRFLNGLRDVDVMCDVGRLAPDSPILPFVAEASAVLMMARPTAEQLQPAARRMLMLRPLVANLGWVLVGQKPYGPLDVEQTYGFPVVGVMADDPRSVAGLERGVMTKRLRRQPFIRSARTLADTLSTWLAPLTTGPQYQPEPQPDVAAEFVPEVPAEVAAVAAAEGVAVPTQEFTEQPAWTEGPSASQLAQLPPPPPDAMPYPDAEPAQVPAEQQIPVGDPAPADDAAAAAARAMLDEPLEQAFAPAPPATESAQTPDVTPAAEVPTVIESAPAPSSAFDWPDEAVADQTIHRVGAPRPAPAPRLITPMAGEAASDSESPAVPPTPPARLATPPEPAVGSPHPPIPEVEPTAAPLVEPLSAGTDGAPASESLAESAPVESAFVSDPEPEYASESAPFESAFVSDPEPEYASESAPVESELAAETEALAASASVPDEAAAPPVSVWSGAESAAAETPPSVRLWAEDVSPVPAATSYPRANGHGNGAVGNGTLGGGTDPMRFDPGGGHGADRASSPVGPAAATSAAPAAGDPDEAADAEDAAEELDDWDGSSFTITADLDQVFAAPDFDAPGLPAAEATPEIPPLADVPPLPPPSTMLQPPLPPPETAIDPSRPPSPFPHEEDDPEARS
ncbi:MAG: hypothetical protein AAF547_07865 [Actinomycetota bacterium]